MHISMDTPILVFDADLSVFPTGNPAHVVLAIGADRDVKVFLTWDDLAALNRYLGEMIDRRTELDADARDYGKLMRCDKLTDLQLA
jgi:hypothetical protein